MLIDYEQIDASARYRWMSQSVIPRPIAWIVTQEGDVVNAAPFSYFTPLSSEPPTVIVSIGHKRDGTPKDTLRNLRTTGKCTLCIAHIDQLEPLHLSSKELEADQGEPDYFSIATQHFIEGYPPMIAGVPVAFACDLFDEVALAESKTVPIILRIRRQHVDAHCLDAAAGSIDFAPLARVGKAYAPLGKAVPAPKIP